MKKVSLILGLSVSFFLVGCAGGKKVSASTPKPVTTKVTIESKDCETELVPQDKLICYEAKKKKAEEQIVELRKSQPKSHEEVQIKTAQDKQEKRAQQRHKEEQEALIKAQPSGCQYMTKAQIPDNPKLYPGSFEELWVEPSETGIKSWQAYGTISIKNANDFVIPVVRSNGRIVARNLCAHGVIKLFHRRDPFLDSNTFNVVYEVDGTFPDGSFGTITSPPLQLSAYNVEYDNGHHVDWVIQFQKYLPQR